MWLICTQMCKNVAESLEVSKKNPIFAPTNLKTHQVMDKINVEMKRNGLTMETDREEFAMALKTWRLRSGRSQDEVAQAWNCSRYTILRAEKAKPISWTMAYRLFAHLARELKEEGDS